MTVDVAGYNQLAALGLTAYQDVNVNQYFRPCVREPAAPSIPGPTHQTLLVSTLQNTHACPVDSDVAVTFTDGSTPD